MFNLCGQNWGTFRKLVSGSEEHGTLFPGLLWVDIHNLRQTERKNTKYGTEIEKPDEVENNFVAKVPLTSFFDWFAGIDTTNKAITCELEYIQDISKIKSEDHHKSMLEDSSETKNLFQKIQQENPLVNPTLKWQLKMIRMTKFYHWQLKIPSISLTLTLAGISIKTNLPIFKLECLNLKPKTIWWRWMQPSLVNF